MRWRRSGRRIQPQDIAEGLADGATAGEICRRIQRHQPVPAPGRDGEVALRAYQGTALFSGLPADFPITPAAVRLGDAPDASRRPAATPNPLR